MKFFCGAYVFGTFLILASLVVKNVAQEIDNPPQLINGVLNDQVQDIINRVNDLNIPNNILPYLTCENFEIILDQLLQNRGTNLQQIQTAIIQENNLAVALNNELKIDLLIDNGDYLSINTSSLLVLIQEAGQIQIRAFFGQKSLASLLLIRRLKTTLNNIQPTLAAILEEIRIPKNVLPPSFSQKRIAKRSAENTTTNILGDIIKKVILSNIKRRILPIVVDLRGLILDTLGAVENAMMVFYTPVEPKNNLEHILSVQVNKLIPKFVVQIEMWKIVISDKFDAILGGNTTNLGVARFKRDVEPYETSVTGRIFDIFLRPLRIGLIQILSLLRNVLFTLLQSVRAFIGQTFILPLNNITGNLIMHLDMVIFRLKQRL